MAREPIEIDAEATEGDAESPIAPESYGRIVELRTGDDVDGDFNGAPELAGFAAVRDWAGVDALDAMRGRDADSAKRADDVPDAERAAWLRRLREELAERLDALGTEIRTAAGEAGGDDAVANAAVVADSLARSISRIDEALQRLLADE